MFTGSSEWVVIISLLLQVFLLCLVAGLDDLAPKLPLSRLKLLRRIQYEAFIQDNSQSHDLITHYFPKFDPLHPSTLPKP